MVKYTVSDHVVLGHHLEIRWVLPCGRGFGSARCAVGLCWCVCLFVSCGYVYTVICSYHIYS
jgi:hypothetical protein